MIRRASAKRAARAEAGGVRIEELLSTLRAAVLVVVLSLAACRDSAWTPMGSADLVLSQIKLGGAATVAKRIDSDESFGRSVMSGIATGDSVWLDVASKITPASATAEASLSIALASALPHSPARVLGLLGQKYRTEEVCGIPFLHSDSATVASYHRDATLALTQMRDTLLTKTRDACLMALDTARNDKLSRIDPAYVVKNKPVPPPARVRKRAAPKPKPVIPPDSGASG